MPSLAALQLATSRPVPDSSGQFRTVPDSSEQFRTVPDSSRTVPDSSEQFRTVPATAPCSRYKPVQTQTNVSQSACVLHRRSGFDVLQAAYGNIPISGTGNCLELLWNFCNLYQFRGTRWRAALQAGRERFRFQMVSLEFFIDFFPVAIWWSYAWSSPLCLYKLYLA